MPSLPRVASGVSSSERKGVLGLLPRRRILASVAGFFLLVAPGGMATAAADKVPLVFAAYGTPLAEPWNMVIHTALELEQQAGKIRYVWKDNLAGSGPMAAAILAAVATQPDMVVADGADGDREIRAIAAANPGIKFVVGTVTEPQAPNMSIFDSDLAEPAYLCGILAGSLTKSGIVGVVGGRSEPHVNRTINAFIAGAHDASATVKVKVTFIDAWYDPPKAKAAALEQIAAGADVIYAEREGAIEACREKDVRAFGNLVDQFDEAPQCVITGPVWNMTPLADYVVKQAAGGLVTAEDLQDFSTLARGGATLAPFHGWEKKLPADVLQVVREKDRALKAGLMTLEPNVATPKGD